MLCLQTGWRVRTSAQTSKVVYSALTFCCTVKLTQVREELWSNPPPPPAARCDPTHSPTGLQTSPALIFVLEFSQSTVCAVKPALAYFQIPSLEFADRHFSDSNVGNGHLWLCLTFTIKFCCTWLVWLVLIFESWGLKTCMSRHSALF